jgi:hypothetical protein
VLNPHVLSDLMRERQRDVSKIAVASHGFGSLRARHAPKLSGQQLECRDADVGEWQRLGQARPNRDRRSSVVKRRSWSITQTHFSRLRSGREPSPARTRSVRSLWRRIRPDKSDPSYGQPHRGKEPNP